MQVETHARKTDPVSSHLAAQENAGRREKQVDLVVQLVKDSPGKTSAELSAITGHDRYMLARRLSDAEKEEPKLLRKGTMRRCGISNRFALTWEPV